MNYTQYLRSDKWKLKRKLLFKKNGKWCQECRSTNKLQVHHIRYDNLFNESLNELKVLCRSCHERQHNIKTPFQIKLQKIDRKKAKRKRRRKNR